MTEPRSAFTIRIADPVGVMVAGRAVATALDAFSAPRAVADDVRLAVETMLDGWVAHPSEDRARRCVLAVACRPGRIAIEARVVPGHSIPMAVLGALVDEVDEEAGDDGSTIGIARSWEDPMTVRLVADRSDGRGPDRARS